MNISANGSSVSGGTLTGLQLDAGDSLQIISLGHYSPSGSVCDANNGGGDISVLGNSNGKDPTVNSTNGLNVGLWFAFENANGQYTTPVNATVQYNSSLNQASQNIAVPDGYSQISLVMGYNTNGTIGCGDMGVYYAVIRCIDSGGNTHDCSTGTAPIWNIGSSGNDIAETFPFSVTGQGGANPTFSTMSGDGGYLSTHNFLQVAVTPGASTQLTLPASGGVQSYTGSYGCISYTISAYDQNNNLLQSQTTETLAVSAGSSDCPSAPTSQSINFSSLLTSGTQTGLYFTVSANNYDFYCKYWYSLYYAYGTASPYYADYSSFCPVRQVYKDHNVTGSLNIITN